MNQAAVEADAILAMCPVRFMPGQEPWKDAVDKWHKQRINVLAALDAMGKAESAAIAPVQEKML